MSWVLIDDDTAINLNNYKKIYKNINNYTETKRFQIIFEFNVNEFEVLTFQNKSTRDDSFLMIRENLKALNPTT